MSRRQIVSAKKMDTIELRPASLADIPVLLQFEQGVVEAERPFDPTLKPSPIHYYDLEELIRGDDSVVMVAECNGQLVGSGYARIEVSKPYLQHGRHAYLGFMYVDPAYRGRGINQKILEALKSWSLAKGITEMRLEVYQGNTAAIRAYEKAGFQQLLVEMRLGIGPADTGD